MTEMPCPLCRSVDTRAFYHYPDFNVLQCRACLFRFIDQRSWIYPYRDEDYYSAAPLTESHSTPPHIQRRIDQVLRHSSGGRCLDIGCGLGEVTLSLANYGFSAEGLDESNNAISALSSKHPEAKWHCGRVQDVLPMLGLFDVVTLYHVLEHFPDPLENMESIMNALRPGGLLVIEVPNIRGLMARIMGRRWHYYLGHHVNYFDPKNLAKLISMIGCETIEARGDYDIAYPGGAPWKLLVKRGLMAVGFNDVISIVGRKHR